MRIKGYFPTQSEIIEMTTIGGTATITPIALNKAIPILEQKFGKIGKWAGILGSLIAELVAVAKTVGLPKAASTGAFAGTLPIAIKELLEDLGVRI
jgi:hypothetical protein